MLLSCALNCALSCFYAVLCHITYSHNAVTACHNAAAAPHIYIVVFVQWRSCRLQRPHSYYSAAANQQGHVNDNNYAESMDTQCVLTIKGYAQAHAAPVPVVT
eukprot:3971-Heterococcus_DN1.PRE.1